MNERPKVGVGVCIVKNGKVLMGKRKNAHGDGTWSFPGGHLEFGESWEECAAREVKEETDLEIQNIKFVGVTNDIFEKEDKHYITIFMIAEIKSGNLRNTEPEKLEKWDWFEWSKLPEPIFIPTRNLINQGFKI